MSQNINNIFYLQRQSFLIFITIFLQLINLKPIKIICFHLNFSATIHPTPIIYRIQAKKHRLVFTPANASYVTHQQFLPAYSHDLLLINETYLGGSWDLLWICTKNTSHTLPTTTRRHPETIPKIKKINTLVKNKPNFHMQMTKTTNAQSSTHHPQATTNRPSTSKNATISSH